MQIDDSGAAVSEEHALGLEQFINLPSASFLCLLARSPHTLLPPPLVSSLQHFLHVEDDVCIAAQVSSKGILLPFNTALCFHS